uniref:(California timema) hypothetical protein n=1 Tax=Timema californicum TaxID=61474 RepID=A0A7R9J6M2_TIMCA|nr:unnamed protein product [Timema californicum]
MERVKTCQELNHDGTICEESRTLKILEELQTLYAERLKRIDDEAGGDGVQLKITTLESWVQDLIMQNAILVHTVELLEHEASERVLLLQKRLQESSKSALKYMTKVQDYDSQMQEATGEKIRSQSQEIVSIHVIGCLDADTSQLRFSETTNTHPSKTTTCHEMVESTQVRAATARGRKTVELSKEFKKGSNSSSSP